MGTTCSNLADTCFLMGNTGVDGRQDTGINNHAAVNAGSRAGKVESRQTEDRVGRQADAAHEAGVSERICDGSAHKLDGGWCRKPWANPPTPAVSVMALSPRSRAGTFGTEAREVETINIG